ncbi:hypothetical protein A2U01_0093453, partial [Trifolium medium]|nr:hypothetical protein [Trifolium medium]
MVKGKEGVTSSLPKGGGNGPRMDKQAQMEKRRIGLRDR